MSWMGPVQPARMANMVELAATLIVLYFTWPFLLLILLFVLGLIGKVCKFLTTPITELGRKGD